MDKESLYELQKIDTNCNDCGFFVRDLAKKNEVMNQFNGTKSGTPEYGRCTKKDVDLYTWSGQCTPHNQSCFVHRKDMIN